MMHGKQSRAYKLWMETRHLEQRVALLQKKALFVLAQYDQLRKEQTLVELQLAVALKRYRALVDRPRRSSSP